MVGDKGPSILASSEVKEVGVGLCFILAAPSRC